MSIADDLLSTLRAARSYVGSKVTPTAPEAERRRRLGLCQSCPETEPGGARLYRIAQGRAVCGAPRMQAILRDDQALGCGCWIDEKTAAGGAHCPRKRW